MAKIVRVKTQIGTYATPIIVRPNRDRVKSNEAVYIKRVYKDSQI